MKIKEYETKLAERPPIVAHSTKVLTEEPFKPKLDPHPELKVVPFNLGMDKRLQQRKEYNENYQRQLAEKKAKVSQIDRLMYGNGVQLIEHFVDCNTIHEKGANYRHINLSL